jgi:hypothetical protein
MMKIDRVQLPTKPIRTKHARELAVAGALGLLALGCMALGCMAPSAARAEDSYFNSMLKSLGLGGDNQIEYRERPPLVVPPSHDLPPPQTTKVRDPNWPAQASDKPKKGTQIRDLDRIPVAPRPAEPSVAGAGTPNPYPSAPNLTADIPQVPQTQPAQSGGLFGRLFSSSDKPASPVTPAPARKSLTEPPPDYESPAPGQPYGTATPPAPPRADAAKAATPEGIRPGPSGL